MVVDVLFFLFLATITAFSAIFWARIVRRPSADYLKVRHAKPFGLIDVITCFFAWIGIPSVVMGLVSSLFNVEDGAGLTVDQQNIASLSVSLAQIFTVSLVFVVAAFRYGGPSKVFGVRRESFWTNTMLAIRAFVLVLPALLLLQWLLALIVPYKHSTLDGLRENFSFFTVLVSWIGAVIAAPYCEEVFFRGFLQGWLQRVIAGGNHENAVTEVFGGWPVEKSFSLQESEKAGVNHSDPAKSESDRALTWWLPIVLSSGLFAAVHIGQGLAPVALFFFGLALGFLYKLTGSILPSIVLHLCLNTFSMFWSTLDLAFSGIKDSL